MVETACGPIDVTINDVDGRLWMRSADRQEPVTREAIDALLSCKQATGSAQDLWGAVAIRCDTRVGSRAAPSFTVELGIESGFAAPEGRRRA